MQTVTINGTEVQFIAFIRIALSEEDDALRLRAIDNVKQEVIAEVLALEAQAGSSDRRSVMESAEFLRWATQSAPIRHEATREFSKTFQRYEGAFGPRNERRLNIAEHIGKLVWLSIKEGTFRGLQTKIGILKLVRHEARHLDIRGGKDKAALHTAWKTYRGVVHLGMAMDLCADNPDAGWDVLDLAETIRLRLSRSCPKGTSTPYVDAEHQLSFVRN